MRREDATRDRLSGSGDEERSLPVAQTTNVERARAQPARELEAPARAHEP
jgi:hypothetical protein